jgi:ferric-dicitrate binding protein FerR (iron transport regulator)
MNLNGDQSSYTVEDFLMDESFAAYCLGRDETAADYWKHWLEAHPDKQSEAAEAKELYFLLDGQNTDRQFRQHEAKFRSTIRQHLQHNDIKRLSQNRRFIIMRITAAAAVILLLLSGLWFFTNNRQHEKPAIAQTQKIEDIAPGGNKAILMLADGTKLVLDSASNGAITKQGNVTVIKMDDGQLSYNASTSTSASILTYNTITTPRGGQYQVVLSDGTKVWLNAASSLRFPTAFVGNDRRVELRGEGYFEVAHNAKKPFYVGVGEMNVQVLGTHFNINSYTDEDAIKTTLLEGSVKVTKGVNSVTIKAGEQVVVNETDNHLAIKEAVNLNDVIAWKNGFFSFRHSYIKEIVKQLSRWYNIEVYYKGDIKNQEFTGKIDRTLSLNQVLKILEKTGVRFQLEEGRKLTILP